MAPYILTTRSNVKVVEFLVLLALGSFGLCYAGNFNKDFDITWGDGHVKILENGKQLSLSLDKASGSGVQSKNEYLFGKIDMQLKLVPGMRVYSSLWNAEDWATRGGLVKTNWSEAPFIASLRNFRANVCVWKSTKSSCNSGSNTSSTKPWLSQKELDSASEDRLKWVQQNYMVYNYCTDTKRFVQGLPPECSLNTTAGVVLP